MPSDPHHPILLSADHYGNPKMSIGEFLGTVKWQGEYHDIYLSEDRKWACYRWSDITDHAIRIEDGAEVNWGLIHGFYILVKSLVDEALNDPSISPNAKL